MNLRQIARLCGGSELLGDNLAAVEPVAFRFDSREVGPGDLFVALPGDVQDGHRYVTQAFDRGACAALVAHQRLPMAIVPEELASRLIFVESTSCAFQSLASRVLALWGGPVVGITGSSGKTTMKDLTAHVLGGRGAVLQTLGNYNTPLGLSMTVSRMICAGSSPADYRFAVLEMGMSAWGKISRMADMASPAIGVVGNVGKAHIEFFGSQERIARAKAEMVDGIRPGGTAVLNADDPRVIAMRHRRDDLNYVTFAIGDSGRPAEVLASEPQVEPDLAGMRFRLRTPAGEAEVRLPLLGRYNVYNALAAAAAATVLGLGPEEIAARLATAEPSRMRGEVRRLANGVTLIDDSYNSSPVALLEAVRALASVGGAGRRRIVVAGEMLELGEEGPALHRDCGREIASCAIDRLIGVRGMARDLVGGAVEVSGWSGDRATFEESPESAAERLLAELTPGDLVLVKGSRGVRLERLVEAVCQASAAR